MNEFKTGDRFQINDGQQPPVEVTILNTYGTKIQTETRLTEGYKQFRRKGETHTDTFQQLIDNGYLTKI